MRVTSSLIEKGASLGLGMAMLIVASASRIEGAALKDTAPVYAAASQPGEPEAKHNPLFEFSPGAGVMGGSLLVGLRASMNYHPVTLEIATDQVMGRTATLYPVTLNAVLDLADLRKTVPYAIVGGGLFLTVPLNSVGDQTISSVGLNFGGGIRYYFTPRLGVRFETKQLFTRIQNRADHRQELLIFQSTSLGVIFAFG